MALASEIETPEDVLKDLDKYSTNIHQNGFQEDFTEDDFRTMLHNAAIAMGDFSTRFRAALERERKKVSKPARNCDRFENFIQAWSEFCWEEHNRKYSDPTDEACEVGDWLLANVKEKQDK